MKFKVKRTVDSAGAPPFVSVIVAGVFIGVFLLALSICMGDLGGNYSALNVSRVLSSNIIVLTITGFLGAVGLFILYTLFFLAPKKYLGIVTYKNKLSDGTARMEFKVSPNEDEASELGKYKIIVEDDGSINEGDMCIAEIKESTYMVKSICKISRQEADYILQSGMLSTGDVVKTQTNSSRAFLELLFKFMALIFAIACAGCLINAVFSLVYARPIVYFIRQCIMAGVMFAAVKYSLKGRDIFSKDNVKAVSRKATGYGLENFEPRLPRRLFVETENFDVKNGNPSVTIKNEMGVMLYYVHRELVSNNFYQIETPDGVPIGSIKYSPMDTGTYRVELFGAHSFTIRRRQIANNKRADYDIEGIDFHVNGSMSNICIYTLDGETVAEMSAGAAQSGSLYPEKLSLETKPDYNMNMYMAAIAACIVANNANLKREGYRG